MMTEVKIAELPESVQEATLASWHKKVGDRVNQGEKLADIETDKITLEIAAETSGVLTKFLKKEGDTLKRGETIAVIDSQAQAAVPSKKEIKETPPVRSTKLEAPEPAKPTIEEMIPAGTINDELPPAVRKLIAENKLNPADIAGSGKGGRLTKADVLRHLEHSPLLATKFGDTAPAIEISGKTPTPSPAAAAAGRPEQRVKMSRLRARIAERLVESQRSAAILSTFNEVNMQAVMSLRERYKDSFEKKYGIKLGFMSFFVKATVEALTKFPIVNASVDGQDIVYHGYFDIGIAISTTKGLVVPILRDADRLSLADIELAISEYAKKAEAGKLTMDDLTGGTFTITNGGVFGSLLSTPIINPPQSAILGMHRIQKKPVAEDDKVVIRPMMYLALSYDHRIIDGREAVQFLVTVKEAIEDPSRLLLEI